MNLLEKNLEKLYKRGKELRKHHASAKSLIMWSLLILDAMTRDDTVEHELAKGLWRIFFSQPFRRFREHIDQFRDAIGRWQNNIRFGLELVDIPHIGLQHLVNLGRRREEKEQKSTGTHDLRLAWQWLETQVASGRAAYAPWIRSKETRVLFDDP